MLGSFESQPQGGIIQLGELDRDTITRLVFRVKKDARCTSGCRWLRREIMQMRLGKRQGLTTGEVSRMLGRVISRSTVIRFFDQGILTGWKHPVTGYRVVDLESVKALARKSGIELSEGMEEWPRRGRLRKTLRYSRVSGPSSQ